ncbi:cAMP-dependent protein kinase catalytic subunit PRKX [Dictyocoela muelleri]|nr:cAMP-dependent protein kinase catalytic subunit PRKX [Dictyocoela muelleri]
MFKLTDFDFIRVLGFGTFGRVYLCRLKLKCPIRYYAIKILRKYDIITKRQVEHVRHEINIIKTLHHKHLVKLYCTFMYDDSICIAMEYVSGGELFTYLRRKGKFSLDETRFFSGEILLALEYLHGQNIIYRDLKPENVLLDKNGHVKLTDFGFAKTTNGSVFTQCGTPDYLAPEVILGKPYDRTVDFWALGIVMFEMITGELPFTQNEYGDLYDKIINENVKFPEVDNNIKDLIYQLLEKDPRRRIGWYFIDEIFSHDFFNDFWDDLRSGKVEPPIKPIVLYDGDSQCFPYYGDGDFPDIEDPGKEYLYRFFQKRD